MGGAASSPHPGLACLAEGEWGGCGQSSLVTTPRVSLPGRGGSGEVVGGAASSPHPGLACLAEGGVGRVWAEQPHHHTQG